MYQFVKLNGNFKRERVQVVEGTRAEALDLMGKRANETGETLYLLQYDPARPNYHDIVIASARPRAEAQNPQRYEE